MTIDNLTFTTYKWSIVNSNVMSFPAPNSDFGGKLITRDAEVNTNLLITQGYLLISIIKMFDCVSSLLYAHKLSGIDL